MGGLNNCSIAGAAMKKEVKMSQLKSGDQISHPGDSRVTDPVIVESIFPFHEVVFDLVQHTVPKWLLRGLFPNRYWLDFRVYASTQIEVFVSPNRTVTLIQSADQPF